MTSVFTVWVCGERERERGLLFYGERERERENRCVNVFVRLMC